MNNPSKIHIQVASQFNGATGGKVASALKISKHFNGLGKGLGIYNVKSTSDQFNNNQIDLTHFVIEESFKWLF